MHAKTFLLVDQNLPKMYFAERARDRSRLNGFLIFDVLIRSGDTVFAIDI